jgi:hypothetical protein
MHCQLLGVLCEVRAFSSPPEGQLRRQLLKRLLQIGGIAYSTCATKHFEKSLETTKNAHGYCPQ